MNKRTLSTALMTVGLVLAFGVATGVSAPSVSVSEQPTKTIHVKASEDTLKDLVANEDVKVNYVWYEINWVGVDVTPSKYAELQARPDVTVEDETYYRIAQGPPGGGSSGPSDQTPYGIEQIYDDSTISSTSGGNGVVLGHLDTGIDADHPDLVNRIVWYEDVDKNGHGTHTAGTAAADAGSDGSGIYGVASEADIRSYKVCNNGGLCSSSNINSAIKDCTNNGNRKCDVITFSIGGDSETSSTTDAIQAFVDAGGLFVAAAGNDGSSLKTIDFPGALDTTVAVAAIDSSKTVTDFSSRGDDDGNCGTTRYDIDFAAAGDNVESTYPDDTYDTLDGTSMATPHISGLGLKEWGGDGATTYSNIASSVEDITAGLHAGSGCDPASGQGLPHVG